MWKASGALGWRVRWNCGARCGMRRWRTASAGAVFVAGDWAAAVVASVRMRVAQRLSLSENMSTLYRREMTKDS